MNPISKQAILLKSTPVSRYPRFASTALLAIVLAVSFLMSLNLHSSTSAQKSQPQIIKVNMLSDNNSANSKFNNRYATNNSESDYRRTAQTLEKFNELISKTHERGSVPVIIGFRFDFKPEGDLTNLLKENQRVEIKQNQDAILKKTENFNPENIKRFETIPYFAMTVNAKTLEFLKTLPEITSISEDEIVAPALTQSIPLVGAPAAWSAGFSGSGWAVAILDTGVDKNHSFLSGKIVSEACYSTNGANSTSVCPGGVSQSTATNSGLNCGLAISGCDHGTHVAGIAAGRGTAFSGVARDANVIAIQVFSRFSSQTDCGSVQAPCARTFTSDQILGLQRVQALSSSMNIAAVNMSLGGGQNFTNCDTDSRKAAIDNLRSVGIATIIASGNNGFTNSISAPACISTAISVGNSGDGSFAHGSTAALDQVMSDSNSASFLNLLAPGRWISSSIPGGTYENFNGTSMATPHVAGAWAVLKQRAPSATVSQVLTALSSTGQPITDFRNGIVKPRIRVDAALQALGGGGCSAPTPINVGQTVNGTLQSGDCLYTDNTYYDAYTFSGTAGQQISISMNSTQFNAYLFLYQGNYPGGTIAAQDNDGGGGTNARIPAISGFFTLPTTGTYTILANTLSVGESGTYNLTLATNNPCDNSSAITLGQTINGTLISTDCLVGGNWYTDKYSFSGTVGQQIIITMNSTAVDSYLILNNSSGQVITQDNDGGGGTNARIPAGSGAFTLPATSTYIIEASTFSIFQTGSYSLSLTSGGVPPTGKKPFDFDGDSRADISIFRPSNGQWWYQQSSNNVARAFTFGVSTDKIVPADYDNDGKTDCAIWRPSTGAWFVLRSSNLTFFSAPFGISTDRPAPGDFDGDGFADLTVFRPSQGVWYINKSSGGVQTTSFGTNGDVPQAVDFDGDNRADIAIYRPANGQWWILRSSNGSVFATTFGVSTDKPVSADYTGDGKADAAFWRPSTGQWFVLRSENLTFYAAQFGSNGDVPVAGDYDGDGRADLAVFRPSNSTWFVLKSAGGTLIQGFGAAGDIPVPSAFVP